MHGNGTPDDTAGQAGRGKSGRRPARHAARQSAGQAADGAGPLALAASAARVEAEARIRAALHQTERSPFLPSRTPESAQPAEADPEEHEPAGGQQSAAGARDPRSGITHGQAEAAHGQPGQADTAEVLPAPAGPGESESAQVEPTRNAQETARPARPEAASGARRWPGPQAAEPSVPGPRDEHAERGPGEPWVGEQADHEEEDLADPPGEPQDHTGVPRRNRITRGYPIPRLSRTRRSGAVPGAQRPN